MIINPSSWYYHRCHASLLNVIHFLIYIYIYIYLFFFCSPFCFTPCCFKKKKTRESTTAPFKMTDCSFVVGVVRHSPYLFFFCVLASGTPSKALLSFFFSLFLSRPMYCVVLYCICLLDHIRKPLFFFASVFFFSMLVISKLTFCYLNTIFVFFFFCCESFFSGNLDVLIHVISFLVFPSPSPHVLYDVVVGVLKRRSYVSVRDVYLCILRFSPRYSLTFDLSVFFFFAL